MSDERIIRAATLADADAVWSIVGPILRVGETYALPRDWSRSDALSYWFSPDHEVFVAETQGMAVGAYFLHANQRGGGAHVANCGYMTAPDSVGRGVAAAMCQHSLAHAAARGFRAMQFNCVVSTNERAVKLWRHLGFDVVGTIPQAFEHPILGFVDTLASNALTDWPRPHRGPLRRLPVTPVPHTDGLLWSWISRHAEL